MKNSLMVAQENNQYVLDYHFINGKLLKSYKISILSLTGYVHQIVFEEKNTKN